MKLVRYKLDPKHNMLHFQNLAAIAREVGLSTAMLCRVRQGTRTISEDMYNQIKKIVDRNTLTVGELLDKIGENKTLDK